MFIFKDWEHFCFQVNSFNIQCVSAAEALSLSKSTERYIIIKHDVETNVKRAIRMAEIENKYGLRATYYVQSYLLKSENNIEGLKKIQKLGHEVTYHYDVLDSNNGDYDLAEKEFDDTLLLFEKNGFSVKTVCPHGNPVMKRDGWSSNKDFFRNKNLNAKYSYIADIVINPEKFINKEMLYVSDAGFGWKIISDISNNDYQAIQKDIKLKSLKDVLKLMNDQNRTLILSAHPHRWQDSQALAIMKRNLFFGLRYTVRALTKIPMVKTFVSRFYYLAKKI